LTFKNFYPPNSFILFTKIPTIFTHKNRHLESTKLAKHYPKSTSFGSIFLSQKTPGVDEMWRLRARGNPYSCSMFNVARWGQSCPLCPHSLCSADGGRRPRLVGAFCTRLISVRVILLYFLNIYCVDAKFWLHNKFLSFFCQCANFGKI
jgi:hypothetical protein